MQWIWWGGVAIPVMSTEDDLRGSHIVGELFDIVGAVLVGVLRRIFGGILFSQLVAIAIAFSSFSPDCGPTVFPYPKQSGAITRSPISRSMGIWYRQPIDKSGNP